MEENDTANIRLGDLSDAIGLLTRLPVRTNGQRGAKTAWAWPVAGAIVGLIAATVAGLALWIGLSSWIAAGMALITQIILTGAMHEDGLADCADGLWGGWDRETRLKIMKDSHIGTYGVVALCLSLLLRWSLIFGLINAGHIFGPLIATAALSRIPMVVLMRWLLPSRKTGLSAGIGRPDQETVILAAAAGLIIALLFVGFATLPAVIAAAATGGAVASIATAKIGGQTGDVLGASQQSAEIGILIALVIWMV